MRAQFTPLFAVAVAAALLSSPAALRADFDEQDGKAVDPGPSNEMTTAGAFSLHVALSGIIPRFDGRAVSTDRLPDPSSPLDHEFQRLVLRVRPARGASSVVVGLMEMFKASDSSADGNIISEFVESGGGRFTGGFGAQDSILWAGTHQTAPAPPPFIGFPISPFSPDASIGPSASSVPNSSPSTPPLWTSFALTPVLAGGSGGAIDNRLSGGTFIFTAPPGLPLSAGSFVAFPAGVSGTSGVSSGRILSNSVTSAAAPTAPPHQAAASIVSAPALAVAPSTLSTSNFAPNNTSSAVSAISSATVSTSLGAAPTASISTAYQFVTVGNPGNANDPATGNIYGGVNYAYDIGQFDVTLNQYTAFLNAVAQLDGVGLYNSSMASDPAIAGIARSGAHGSYQYSVIGDGNRPVTYVTWLDAARYANWMQNGQPTGLGEVNASTEDGAYALHGALTGVFTKKSGALYWIPTESEWYKAAYYDPSLNGGAGGYWTNGTMGNGALGNTIGSLPNQANYYNGSYSTGGVNGNLTDVGAFTMSLSAYGLYDASGDVYQWNDAIIGGSRGLRGGAWDSTSYLSLLSSDRSFGASIYASDDVGFRLATIPEPSPCIALAGGVALLLAWRRRRTPRT